MNGEAESLKKHSRDSLVYLTTCMIGHLVEAHLTNGSVYSGIFHAADVEKDFGIILKRASLIKDGTLGDHKSGSEVVRKPPTKTFFIPADELVQVVAKDLSVFSDGMLNAIQSEKSVELLTDSSISKSCHVGQKRELKPWVPDEEAPEGLDNVFDESLKRGWGQFKVNEEDYKLLDTCNDHNFSGSSTSNGQNPASSCGQKPTSSSGKGYGGESQPFQNETNVHQSCSISDDDAGHISSEQKSKDFPAQGSSISESQLGERRNNKSLEVAHSNRSPEASVSGHGDTQGGGNLGGGGTLSSKTVADKESQVCVKTKSESSFGQSDPRRSSESGPAQSTSTRTGLSPSSSTSSLPSSEKSTLNPNAKEFKPSQSPAPVRPQSPIAKGSFYYVAPPAPVQQMPGMPAGYGMQIQPHYPGQPHLLRYPGHEYPETYYPPNAPPWFQELQKIYMQLPHPYPPENPHNQG